MINNRQAGRRRGRGGQRPPNSGGRPDGGSRIDNRARGNASQLLEKYRNLASDAQRQGDRVNTEYFLQFADHYFRVLNENRPPEQQQQRRWREDGDEDDGYDDRGGNGEDARFDGDREPERAERQERNGRPRDDERPREEMRPRDENGQRRTYRQEREQLDRQEAERAPHLNGSATAETSVEQPRRPRRPRETFDDDAGETRLSADMLPPAIAVSADPVDDEPPAPRRRLRRPRAEAGTDEAPANA